MAKRDYINAPIHPNKGAGGVRIGAKAKAIIKRWGEPADIEQIKPNHVCWHYPNISFWLKDGQVSQIGLKGYYQGRTKEGIGISSSKDDVEQAYGMLEWDGTWLINCPPFGIGFDFGYDYELTERVTDIFVFNE